MARFVVLRAEHQPLDPSRASSVGTRSVAFFLKLESNKIANTADGSHSSMMKRVKNCRKRSFVKNEVKGPADESAGSLAQITSWLLVYAELIVRMTILSIASNSSFD